jgi:hypothetical protein
LWNVPSVPNVTTSSNRHALTVTDASSFDHQFPTSPALGPTARAPAAGANFQSPDKAEIDEAVPEALVAATTIEAGGVTTGAVKSAIVNTAVAVAVRFEESAMLKVTVVAPIGNTSGASLPIPSVIVPSTLSVDVAVASHAATPVAVLAVPLASVAVIVVASGAVITGGD